MSVDPTNRSADLLVSRTHLLGMAVSLIGGDPGVPMSHIPKFGSVIDLTQSLDSPLSDAQIQLLQ
jgi:hypothetical protein